MRGIELVLVLLSVIILLKVERVADLLYEINILKLENAALKKELGR